ncbi:MAG: STT3 domain-containing protein [Candidatus Omnitrophica bacterium]|nr:STT3 domain-containing protein [Candidatus Omnitrophota bacterium]
MKAVSNKILNRFILFTLILLAIAINIYFRLDPLFLNALKYISQMEVYSKLETKLDKYVSDTYPWLTPEAKKNFITSISPRYLKENKAEIDKSISQTLETKKEYYRDNNGFTYLLEEDPYRWMRRIDNILNTGHAGTRLVNGKEWDDLKNAPFGGEVEPLKFHYYAGAYFYKLLHAINNRLSLMNCLSFFPLFLSAVMVLVIFGFCAAFGISRWSAFLASLAIGVSKFLLSRSGFGWFDTDLYNIIFPLLTMALLMLAIKRSGLRRYNYILLAALAVGAYSASWTVWWMSFFIIIFSLLLYQIEYVIYEEKGKLTKRLKEQLLFLVSFVFFSYVFVLLLSGQAAVKGSIAEPLSYLKLGSGLTIDGFWPNIGYSIHELRRPKVADIVIMCGGIVVYAGIAGLLVLALLRKRFLSGSRRFFFFIVFAWFVAGMVLVNYGLRFVMFLILPLGLSFAVLWDLAFYFFSDTCHKTKLTGNASIRARQVLAVLLFLVMSVPVISNARKITMLPIINDTWWKALNVIKEKTPANAIINTAWDYADSIMAVSNRATVYDGSWQYTPVSYWIPRVLLAQSEDEALGILRMLDCGSGSAFNELNEAVSDKMTALGLINKLIATNEKEAVVILSKYVSDKAKIEKILKLLYCNPPPAYLLVDDSLVSARIITRPAAWDFEKSDLWEKFNKLNKKDFFGYMRLKLGYSGQKSQELYGTLSLMGKNDALNWIAPFGPAFYLGRSKQAIEGDSLVIFDNGIVLDKKNFKTYFNDISPSAVSNPQNFSGSANMIIPASVIVASKEGVSEMTNKEGDANYTVFLEQDENAKYAAYLLDSSFAHSLLFKLYFLKDNGLKHFELVFHEKEDATNIYLYKIIW